MILILNNKFPLRDNFEHRQVVSKENEKNFGDTWDIDKSDFVDEIEVTRSWQPENTHTILDIFNTYLYFFNILIIISMLWCSYFYPMCASIFQDASAPRLFIYYFIHSLLSLQNRFYRIIDTENYCDFASLTHENAASVLRWKMLTDYVL